MLLTLLRSLLNASNFQCLYTTLTTSNLKHLPVLHELREWLNLQLLVIFLAAFLEFTICLSSILKGTPCRFLEIFFCIASSSGSLPHKFQLPLPLTTLISVPSTQWYCFALLEIPFLHNDLQIASRQEIRMMVEFT